MRKYNSTKIEDINGNVQNPSTYEMQDEILRRVKCILPEPDDPYIMVISGNLTANNDYVLEQIIPAGEVIYIDSVFLNSYVGSAYLHVTFEDGSGNVLRDLAYISVDANYNEMNAFQLIKTKLTGDGDKRVRLVLHPYASTRYYGALRIWRCVP